jgi:glycine cleavage system aminomethyltransferase T
MMPACTGPTGIWCRLSPSLGRRIALGFAAAGTTGEVRLADGRLARVAPLPFYDPDKARPRATPL